MLVINFYNPEVHSTGNKRINKFLRQFEQIFESIYVVSFTGKIRYYNTDIKNHFILRSLIKISNSYPFHLLLRKEGFPHLFTSLLKSYSLVKKNSVTHLFSSHHPITNHWISYFLKIHFPQLIWIVDFRDHYPDYSKSGIWFISFHEFLLRILLKKADIITTVSHGLANRLEMAKKPLMIIRNYPLNEINHLKKRMISIAYTGSIYPKNTSISLLLKVLKEYQSTIQFVFYYCGKDRKSWDNWFKNYPEIMNLSTGHVPHQTSLSIQKLGDIMLVLTWNTENIKGILTSKLGEYLIQNKPILIIIHGNVEKDFKFLNYTHSNCYLFYTAIHTENDLHRIIKECINNIDNQFFKSKKIDFEFEFEKLKSLIITH